MTKDEMDGRHHQLNGHKFEQTLGDSEGQGRQVCCSSRGRPRERHDLATEQQQMSIHVQRDGDEDDDDGGREGKINTNTDDFYSYHKYW